MLEPSTFHLPNLSFLPSFYRESITYWVKNEGVHFYIAKNRKSKVGDYRYLRKYKLHKITVNQDLDPVFFLLTFLHELAHKKCFDVFKGRVNPHGKEWKNEFLKLLTPIPSYIDGYEREVWEHHIAKLPSTFNFVKTSDPDYSIEAGSLEPGNKFETDSKNTYEIIRKNRTRMICKNLENSRLYHVSKFLLVKKIN